MEKISIQDVASVLIDKSGLKKKDAEQFALTMFDIIKAALLRDKLVKIKGFGTFKIIDIDARESVNVNTGERVTIEGHERVTFTPEAIMKTLVNKPFSQFETVVLNEGVMFDDLGTGTTAEEDDVDEEPFVDESVEQAETAVEEAVQVVATEDNIVEEQPVEETEAADEQEPPLIEFFEPESTPPAEEEHADDAEENTDAEEEHVEVEEETIDAEDEHADDEEEKTDAEEESIRSGEEHVNEQAENVYVEDEYADEQDNGSRWAGWKTVAIAAVACLVGFGGGYYCGHYMATEYSEPIPLPADTIFTDMPDSAATDTIVAEPTPKPAPVVKDTIKPTAPVAAPKTSKDVLETTDYGAMDNRVRLGAYRIVGTDRIVQAKEGQDIGSIARRILGPGMECYLEVVNGIKSGQPLKAGQEIIIPKLENKKVRQRQTAEKQ